MGLRAWHRSLYGHEGVEANLIWKLDLALLPYFSVIYFLFNLERASYSYAYISGMQKDVGFVGKEFNYMLTCFLVGFAVFQAPFTMLLGSTKPRYVFFIANIMWSLLTLISFRMNHVYQFYIINLLEGIFTSGAFVGAHFMLGSWYKKSELGKRAAIFVSCGDIGSMAGGWIEGGLFASLNGKGGLPPWRWIYIIVFVMTIPFVFIGYFAMPDLPRHANAWFLTAEEKQCAIDRLQRKEPAGPLTLKVVFRVVQTWQFWMLPFIFFLYGVSVQMLGNNVMPLWMESKGYTVVQMNNYPTAIFACSIVGTIGYSYISDKLGSRWQSSVAIGLTFTIGCAILLSNASDGGKFFAFYLLGTCLAPQALWFTWCADLTEHDLYLRSITTGWMNAIDEAFIAWWPIVFYPVTDAPNYRNGYIASIVLGTLIIPTVGVIVYLDRRDQRLRGENKPDTDEETPDLIGSNESSSDEQTKKDNVAAYATAEVEASQ